MAGIGKWVNKKRVAADEDKIEKALLKDIGTLVGKNSNFRLKYAARELFFLEQKIRPKCENGCKGDPLELEERLLLFDDLSWNEKTAMLREVYEKVRSTQPVELNPPPISTEAQETFSYIGQELGVNSGSVGLYHHLLLKQAGEGQQTDQGSQKRRRVELLSEYSALSGDGRARELEKVFSSFLSAQPSPIQHCSPIQHYFPIQPHSSTKPHSSSTQGSSPREQTITFSFEDEPAGSVFAALEPKLKARLWPKLEQVAATQDPTYMVHVVAIPTPRLEIGQNLSEKWFSLLFLLFLSFPRLNSKKMVESSFFFQRVRLHLLLASLACLDVCVALFFLPRKEAVARNKQIFVLACQFGMKASPIHFSSGYGDRIKVGQVIYHDRAGPLEIVGDQGQLQEKFTAFLAGDCKEQYVTDHTKTATRRPLGNGQSRNEQQMMGARAAYSSP